MRNATCATCSTCPFYFVGPWDGASLRSECRRHPPDSIETDDDPAVGVWPTVDVDEWCGEHPDRLMDAVTRTEEK